MRFAILQVYKLAEHYFPTVQHAAWVAGMRALGLDAETAEFVLVPEVPEAPQLAELALRLQDAAYDVLFVDRVWSAELRRALGPRLVVSLAHADLLTQGLVDAAITHVGRRSVVETARALSAAEVPPAWTGWVTDAAAIEPRAPRRQATPLAEDLLGQPLDLHHHRVLSRQRSNPDHVVIVANLGCAYRQVPNDTGVMDGLDLPATVTTAGCTFCDAESYEKMAVPDALATLAAQTRAWLAERPEVRTIAVKDDHALRYLDQLLPTLEAAGLDGRDVLLSARPDYLTTYADAIERQLQRQVPGKLGFYLLGLENFADAELKRFHKGMTRADMMAAVERMRRWKTTYPERFRVSPSAGFILFTPWTTLEDLRQNAEAIAALDLAEQRGGLALSRLRLYPNLPLYWLAKRDGLLLTQLEAGDVGDAARRGYEADHPWRFQHPEVATIYRDVQAAGDHATEVLLRRVLPSSGSPLPKPPVIRHGTVSVKVNDRCNQTCAFCTARSDGPMSSVPQSLVTQKLTVALQKRPTRVLLGGAEPTLEPWLEALLAQARAAGVDDIVLETNATQLTPERVASLVAAGLTRAHVAVNASEATLADAISGGGHAQTIAGLRALHAAGVLVDIVVPLLPANAHELPAIARALPTWLPDAESWTLLVRPIRQARTAMPLLTTAQVAHALDAVWATAADRVQVLVAPGVEPPPCAFGHPRQAAQRLGLDPDRAKANAQRAQRTDACAECLLAAICPGVAAPDYADFARQTRPVTLETSPVVRVDPALGIPPDAPAWTSVQPLDLIEGDADPPIELVQLHAGLRPLAKLEFTSPQSLARVLPHVAAMQLHAREQPATLLGQSAGVTTLLWVAREPHVIDQAQAVEARIHTTALDSMAAVAEMGRLLAFPPCCVAFHARQSHQDDAAELQRLRAEASGPIPWPLNWGAFTLRLFGHTPCSATCAATLALAGQTWQALERADPGRARVRKRLLQSVVLAPHPLAFALLLDPTRLDDGGIAYADVQTSLAGDPAPDFRTRAWDAYVGDALRAGRQVRATATGLTVTDARGTSQRVALAPAPTLLDFTGAWP